MESKDQQEKRIEATLASLDGTRRASPAPWLFSRVKARLAREIADEKTVWGFLGSLLSKPAVTLAGLALIFLLNGVFLYEQHQEKITAKVSDELPPNDSESYIVSSSSFDYENLVQP
jgi:hypothetical protein